MRAQAVIPLLVVLACGNTEDTAATARKNREEACRISAQALCARVESCSPLYTRYFFDTTSDCEAMVNDACLARYSGAGASKTPKACAAEAAAAPCAEITDPQGSVFFSTAQYHVLKSCPVTPGAFDDHAQACTRDGDCKSGKCGEIRAGSGVSCYTQESSTPATGPLLDEGAKCDVTSPPGGCNLSHGLVCADDDATCHALAIVGPGESCTPNVPGIPKSTARLCDARARCSAEGTCVAAPRRGEPCTDKCRVGLVCTNGQCVTDVRP